MKFLIHLQAVVLLGFTLFTPVPALAVNFQTVFQNALTKSEKVAQSHEGVNQAEEKIRQARGAVLPNLTFNGSHIRQELPSDPFARQFSPDSQTAARLTLTQPIFRGMSEYAVYRQSKNNLNSQKHMDSMTRIQLYQDVATNYFTILSLEADIRNMKEQTNLYGQQVKDLDGRTRRGESNVTEALTAQSSLASLEAEIQLVTGQLASARELFAFFTGLDANTPLEDISKTGNEIATLLKDVNAYVNRVEERPDVQSAKEQLKAAEEQIRIERGGHYPQLDAVGNYHLRRPVAFLEDIKWDVELRLSFPIFEGGNRQARVREAASKKHVQDLELSRLRRTAIQQIRSLHQSLLVRMQQVQSLERTVGIAEKNYKVLQREFRNGLVRSVDAQVAMNQFRMARRTYDQARYAAQVDLASLEAAAFLVPIEVTQ